MTRTSLNQPAFVAKLLMVAALSILASTTCLADTLHVAPLGSNARSRAQARNRATPWKTIQHAINASAPGDTIILLAGVYNERVRIRKSGRPGREIVLRSERKEGARLFGDVFTQDQSYIEINGLDITNAGLTGQTKGINFARCHHVTVRNCRVRDCRGGGIGFDQSDWILCEWNIVHGNAFYDRNQHSGISVYQPQYRGSDSRRFGIIIRNNTSFNNRNLIDNPRFGRPTDGNGIVVDDFFNQQSGGNGRRYNRLTVIENNLCFNNGGQGIHCYLSQNIRIRNNTCQNNLDSFDFGGEVTVSESERVYVYNNILISSPGKFAAFQFDSDRAFFYFNLFDGPTREVALAGNIVGDANLIPGTFEPASDSRAIDFGLDAGDHYFLDVYGRNRTNGRIDIGAIESR